MGTTLKLTDNAKSVTEVKLKQQRVIPTATVLYTDSGNMPSILSANTLLYTTDTRELFIGGTDGVKRVNLGSDGNVIDKSDYLTKTEIAQLYVQKDYLDPNKVITTDNFNTYIKSLATQVEGLIADNEYKADTDSVYTKEESDARFIDYDEFDQGLVKKVPQEILTNTGSHSYIKNASTGSTLRFQNVANNTESYLNVGKDGINIKVNRSTEEAFGGRLYLTTKGVFYTNTDNEEYDENDEVFTFKDFLEAQESIETLKKQFEEVYRVALGAVDAARTSAQAAEATRTYATSAFEIANQANAAAAEALGLGNEVKDNLESIEETASNSLQRAETAMNSANAAQTLSVTTSKDLKNLQSSVANQIVGMQSQIDNIGTSEPASPVQDTSKKITNLADLSYDTIEVDYYTDEDDLELPATAEATLDDGTKVQVNISWTTTGFTPRATDVLQRFNGYPVETESVKNPFSLFTQCIVRVLPREAEDDTPEYVWTTTFALPSMTTEVEGFANKIGHASLTSEDMIGTYSDDDQTYVPPTVELLFIGTLKKVSTSTDIILISAAERNTLLNKDLLDMYPDGLKVPVAGIASNSEISAYEMKALSGVYMKSNGAYTYGNATLSFDYGADSNNVYIIRKRKQS